MEYILDGKKMTSRRSAHEEIASAMHFPEYYGHNLDALYDMLSQTRGQAKLINVGAALANLEGYGCNLLKTFYDAMQDNPNFKFFAE